MPFQRLDWVGINGSGQKEKYDPFEKTQERAAMAVILFFCKTFAEIPCEVLIWFPHDPCTCLKGAF